MNITNNHPELEKKLKSLYTRLNNSFKEDVDNFQLQYTDKELPLHISATTVTEHVHYTRLNKIELFKTLVENWEAFKTTYAKDPILNKIGVEILENKMYFDDKVLDTIKNYPNSKQVLYYFKKGQQVDLPTVTGKDYESFKSIILNDILPESQLHLTQKNTLLQSLSIINSDKSQDKLNYLYALSEGTANSGKVNTNAGDILSNIKEQIKLSNFEVEQKGEQLIVQIPLPGIKIENQETIKYDTSLLSVNLNNPKDFSIEVGCLHKPITDISLRIERMLNLRKEMVEDFPKITSTIQPHIKPK